MAKSKNKKQPVPSLVPTDAIPAAPPADEEHAADKQLTRSATMTEDGRLRAVELFSQGYTVRYVRSALKEVLGRVPTEQEVLRIAVESGDDITRLRKELESVAFERGIASKAMRMDRLNRLAEALEPQAMDGNSKAANSLLAVLKQAREEVDPLGLQLVLPKNDPWAELLMNLRDAAQKRLTLPEETQIDRLDQDQMESISSSINSESIG